MTRYRVTATVKEVKGKCPLYRLGDKIVFEGFYVKSKESNNICIHAFSAMSTLLSALLHGASMKDLGIGEKPDLGYIQCPGSAAIELECAGLCQMWVNDSSKLPTDTLNDADAELPALSVAEHATFVNPIANVEPDEGVQVGVNEPSTASNAEAVNATTVPPAPVASTVTSAGTVTTGAVSL